jgi:hypothetical protein
MVNDVIRVICRQMCVLRESVGLVTNFNARGRRNS